MKKLIIGILASVIALVFINAKTDLFSNLGKNAPFLQENFPELTETIEDAADHVKNFTDRIPTFRELVAIIKDEPLPIDPADVAVNAYIKNSPMLTFYPTENVSAKMTADNRLRLFGISPSNERSNFIITFSVGSNELERTSTSVDRNDEFDKTIKIPETNADVIKVDIYTGSREYGSFSSWVYNYLYLERSGDNWSIKRSPVYDHNKAKYTEDKSVSLALDDTPSIESDEEEIIDLAANITRDASSDYEKLVKIHDWVCANISYDTDKLKSSETAPYGAREVLKNKSAVCLGFSTLTAALCRSCGIPCNVVSGYALGVGADTEWTNATVNTDEQNHAWNEAHVDGRWIILDTTWDCAGKIEHGERITGEVSHIYFDANLDFFSANHKIIEYMRKP